MLSPTRIGRPRRRSEPTVSYEAAEGEAADGKLAGARSAGEGEPEDFGGSAAGGGSVDGVEEGGMTYEGGGCGGLIGSKCLVNKPSFRIPVALYLSSLIVHFFARTRNEKLCRRLVYHKLKTQRSSKSNNISGNLHSCFRPCLLFSLLSFVDFASQTSVFRECN